MSLTLLAALGLAAAQPAAETTAPAPNEVFAGFAEQLAESGQFEGTVHVESVSVPATDVASGLADAQTGRVNTPDTLFHIASITKAFTATLVMRAAERDQLSLDDPLVEWVSELDQDTFGDVTLRHLLEHTSGIMRDHTEALSGEPNSEAAMFRALNSVGLQSPTGERYNYSNTGYALLATVLERATEHSYADLLRTVILEPAGMEHTTLGLPDAPLEYATGYDMPDTVTRVAVDPTSFRGGLPGASGIFSTSADLVRFGQALEQGELVSQASVDDMLAAIEEEGSDGDNAMGWMRVGLGGEDVAWVATGASDGYLSMLLIDNRADDLAAAAVQNNSRAGRPGSIELLRGVIYVLMIDRPDSASVPETPLADFLAVLDREGVEAARAYRATLDLSQQDEASAAAFQAEGAPDGGVGETALAWAPATADAREEWLQVGFEPGADARWLDVHFTQIPDALTAVRVGADAPLVPAAEATRLASEAGAPVVRFSLEAGAPVDTVTVHLDTAATPGWPQIDAVGLVSADGTTRWALSSDASTSAFMSGSVSIHDLPTDPILDKLARRLDEQGQAEISRAVRAVLDEPQP